MPSDEIIAKQKADIEYLKADVELLKKLELAERNDKESRGIYITLRNELKVTWNLKN